MTNGKVLIVGGGIAGLTSAIALGQRGFSVDLIEKDPDWSVYGVGIIQQANVIRAMVELGVVDDYLDAGFGFDHVEIYAPNGELAAKVPSQRLVAEYPAQMGITRPELQRVLADRARQEGARIRLGVVVASLAEEDTGVVVGCSDGSSERYDVVVGADGINSQIRSMLFADYPEPEFAGQSVWRYNFKRPDDVVALHAHEGPMGVGLVPLSEDLMYLYMTTPEAPDRRYAKEGIAGVMADKLRGAPPGARELADQITDDAGVVYRPLAWHFLEGDWHKGHVMLIGDAAHGTTPHLGQGAGMAIEDSLVLAEELARHDSVQNAFAAFMKRRHDRCKYIVEASVAICKGQLGEAPMVDYPKATAEMIAATSQPL